MPEFHNQIISVGQKLGYYYSAKFEGTCNGYTLKWLEACLLGEDAQVQYEEFKRAVIRAYEQENILKQVNFVKTKVKNQQPLAEEEQNLLNLLAFYETMILYHNPLDYYRVFNKAYSQHDVEHSSYLAGSEKLRKQGGLVNVYSEVGVYSKDEIKKLLEQFEIAIAQLNYPGEKVAFLCVNEDHAIGLIYNRLTQQWMLKDINNESLSKQAEKSKDSISNDIFIGFKSYYPQIEIIKKNLQKTAEKIHELEDIEEDDSFSVSFPIQGQSIELTYQPSNQQWTFDQDQDNSFSTEDMAKNIELHLLESNKDTDITFAITFISTVPTWLLLLISQK